MTQEDWNEIADMVKRSQMVVSDKMTGEPISAFFNAFAFEAQLRKKAAGALSIPGAGLILPNGKPA